MVYGSCSTGSDKAYIDVDLAGILGGCMASAKGGSMQSGVGHGRGAPLPSRLESLGERRELLQRGPGQSPTRKRILAYFEGFFVHI